MQDKNLSLFVFCIVGNVFSYMLRNVCNMYNLFPLPTVVIFSDFLGAECGGGV